MESLEKEKQSMALGRRQSPQGLVQLKRVELPGLLAGQAAQKFGANRAGGGHRRTAVAFKIGRRNSLPLHLQKQPEAISATRITRFGRGLKDFRAAPVVRLAPVMPDDIGIHFR